LVAERNGHRLAVSRWAVADRGWWPTASENRLEGFITGEECEARRQAILDEI
jgi:hypothetical protein